MKKIKGHFLSPSHPPVPSNKRNIIRSRYTFLQPISTPPSPLTRAGFPKIESSLVVVDSKRDANGKQNTNHNEERNQIRYRNTWKYHTLYPHIVYTCINQTLFYTVVGSLIF